jgi:hypothetical protein
MQLAENVDLTEKFVKIICWYSFRDGDTLAPDWAQSVSILLVCNWSYSVGQNHLYVNMFFNRNSTIQKCLKEFCTVYKSEESVPCQPSGRCVLPSGRSSVHSS